MSAIQLLESIAANPDIKNQVLSGLLDGETSSKLSSFISEIENGKEPMYCVMFPAEDDEKKEESPDETEDDKKEEVSQKLN